MTLEELRRHAFGVAYRMLGSVADAEDVVQEALLAEDAVLYSDGGARVSAARRPILGPARIARFMAGTTRLRRRIGPFEQRLARVNG